MTQMPERAKEIVKQNYSSKMSINMNDEAFKAGYER